MSYINVSSSTKMETLTRDLIESHLMSFIEIHSEVQSDGVTRFAWSLSGMALPASEADTDWSYQFKSYDTARNYAFGWIRRNHPDLERAAVQEAKEGIRYRASKTK